MGEIIRPHFNTTVPEPADQVLEKAKGQGLDTVVVVGLLESGDLWVSGNQSDLPLTVYLLEKAKAFMME